MFRAKDFYELTGLKRSTVRYYQRQGMLMPSRVEENGYAYYDDKALIDAMMVRNYRCVGFGVEELFPQAMLSLEGQIDHMRATRAEYVATIAELERKIRSLDVYVDYMERSRQIGEVIEGTATVGLSSFYIKEALASQPKAAREEIAHCINSFPYVHTAGRGELEELSDHGVIHFEPGYEFRGERGLFEPLHPELFTTRVLTPGLMLRLKAAAPLCLTEEELTPLLAELKRRGLPLEGQVTSIISAVEPAEDGMKYLVTVRAAV